MPSLGLSSIQTKTCSRCHATKPLDNFATDARYSQGVVGWCKPCKAQNGREYGERQLRSTKPVIPFKTCTACKERKEADAFALCPSKKHGLSARCKACRRILEAHPYKNGRARASYLKRTFGLTEETVNQMREAQGNRCALCSVSLEGGKSEIDHCHASGKVRGLVCARCNRWMAAVDHPGWLEKALAYKARTS